MYVVCRMFLVEVTKDPVYSLTMVGAVFFYIVIKNYSDAVYIVWLRPTESKLFMKSTH